MMRTLQRLVRRRRPAPPRRSSQVDIAVLEHDLYGVQPEPNSMAALAIGLRALANAGTSGREMMHRMSDCPATGHIVLNGQSVGVICNLPPHQGGQHHDVVHGDWEDEHHGNTEEGPRGDGPVHG